MAVQEIEAVWRAKRLPIVVGGTGLYIKALLSGLSELPGVPEDIRSAARATYYAIGAGAFHARLASVDPEAAARIAGNGYPAHPPCLRDLFGDREVALRLAPGGSGNGALVSRCPDGSTGTAQKRACMRVVMIVLTG